jgi:hypothetical protein
MGSAISDLQDSLGGVHWAFGVERVSIPLRSPGMVEAGLLAPRGKQYVLRGLTSRKNGNKAARKMESAGQDQFAL